MKNNRMMTAMTNAAMAIVRVFMTLLRLDGPYAQTDGQPVQ
jgi:hypothetical protein